MNPTTPIEWPRGSGRIAHYSEQERQLMREMADVAKMEGWSELEVSNQVTILHDLKVEFGADLMQLVPTDVGPREHFAPLLSRSDSEREEALTRLHEAARARADAPIVEPEESFAAKLPEDVKRALAPTACVFCGREIDSKRTGAYRKVVGFEHHRRAGGTNALALREPLDEWACATCITRLSSGVAATQEALAL